MRSARRVVGAMAAEHPGPAAILIPFESSAAKRAFRAFALREGTGTRPTKVLAQEALFDCSRRSAGGVAS
ncbi:hypothetical protein BURKHO8Y_180119 [Burkholderia sp. 8Y]|nr:hypothetical protein BURKHO8Y_180119 [Burkholderia sp. 8Y]